MKFLNMMHGREMKYDFRTWLMYFIYWSNFVTRRRRRRRRSLYICIYGTVAVCMGNVKL